jgi:hypothetical protein
MIYVHHHLGLGDHIVCNAIVRDLYSKYGPLTLAVKEHNYPSVKQLYKDLDVQFHRVKSDADCIPIYFKIPTMRIGFEHCREDWEKSFYDQVGLDYSKRFSGFHIDRDLDREQALEDKLNLPEEYAFVNKTASTGSNELDLKTNLPLVELQPITDSIFDWIGVINKAKEIHTIDSSIFQLIRQLPVNGDRFFYDMRKVDPSRTTPPYEDTSWTII